MNQKGSIDTLVTALVGLMVGIITLYVVMAVWQPITTLYLYPMLNNAEAFTYGAATVTILQLLVLVVAVGIFVWFFKAITGKDQPPGQYY